MEFQSLIFIAVGSIFISNFVLHKFLGLCPYIGVSKQLDSAVGMGMAVIFVMTIASMVTWTIYNYFLAPTPINLIFRWFMHSQGNPPDLTYLRTIAFILVIAALVQFVEMVIHKVSPGLYRSLGIYLPLITTNCAIMGVSLLNINEEFNFIESIVNGAASGIGFTLALVLMAGLRERLEYAKLPKAIKGAPIAFIMAGLISLAFLGFTGLKVTVPDTPSLMVLSILILLILEFHAIWTFFEKAGIDGLIFLIPIYNIYLFCKIADKPGWWTLLLIIPGVNIICLVLVNVSIAQKFSKGVLFGLGLTFLSPIFFPILAYSSSPYKY